MKLVLIKCFEADNAQALFAVNEKRNKMSDFLGHRRVIQNTEHMLLFLSENTHVAAEEIYIFSVIAEADRGTESVREQSGGFMTTQ